MTIHILQFQYPYVTNYFCKYFKDFRTVLKNIPPLIMFQSQIYVEFVIVNGKNRFALGKDLFLYDYSLSEMESMWN